MNVAGIDGHAQYLVVTVLSNRAKMLHPPVRIKNAEAYRLVELLEPFRPLEAVVETSPAWPWLHDLLVGHGFGFVLAHAKKLRAISEANYKRDEIDAELLARVRLAGLIPEVHPKSIEQREQAVLVRHRARLVKLRTSAAGRIHAELHSIGMHLERGRLLTQGGRRWLRTRAWPLFGPEQRLLVRSQLAIVRGLNPMVRALDRRIVRIGSEIPAVALLQTVPGIGPYRGLLIATEVLPIERFPSPRHLVSYSGLAPRSNQSGSRPIRHGPIPAGANRWLRAAFVRTIVSHHMAAPSSWLSLYYDTQKQRLGWQVARVAAARKLARAVHAMLRTGEVWMDDVPQSDEKGRAPRLACRSDDLQPS
jgi:transposase